MTEKKTRLLGAGGDASLLSALQAMASVYLDEDTVKVPGLNFAIISFVGPSNPQKCDKFGLKISGAFETYEQASEHALRLSKVDPTFDVFVTDMYRWVSAPPDANLINKKVYNDPTLNKLMESYEEEQQRAKEVFEERKATVMKEGLEAVEEETFGGDPARITDAPEEKGEHS